MSQETEFTKTMCAAVERHWPCSIAMIQTLLRDTDRQAQLSALVRAEEYIIAKHPEAAHTLHVLTTVELAEAKRTLTVQYGARFEEEKPPAGHHAAPRDDAEEVSS